MASHWLGICTLLEYKEDVMFLDVVNQAWSMMPLELFGVSSELASRPGPLRRGPGTYCMGDSAHAQTESPRIWGFVYLSKLS